MHAAVGAAGELPEHPRVDGAEREVGVGRRRRPRAAATTSFDRREVRVEHEPGRARGSSARARRRAARRSVRRCAGPATRSRGARGRPVRRSQTTTVSRWFVMPIAAIGLARVAQLGRDLGERLDRDAPDVVGVVLDPARAAGSAAGTRGTTRRAGRPSSPTANARTPGGAGVDRDDARHASRLRRLGASGAGDASSVGERASRPVVRAQLEPSSGRCVACRRRRSCGRRLRRRSASTREPIRGVVVHLPAGPAGEESGREQARGGRSVSTAKSSVRAANDRVHADRRATPTPGVHADDRARRGSELRAVVLDARRSSQVSRGSGSRLRVGPSSDAGAGLAAG